MMRCGGTAILFPIIIGGFVLTAAPSQAWAQQVPRTATIEDLRLIVEELQRVLEEREAVIAALVQRMSELERQAGIAARDPALPPAVPPAHEPPSPRAPDTTPAAEAEDAELAGKAAPAGPGQVEVDEEEVATALERALVQEGAVLLPPGTVQLEPSFAFTRGEMSALSLGGQDQGISVRRLRQNSLTFGQRLLFGLPFNAQLGLSVPYRYEEEEIITRGEFAGTREDNGSAAGFGDLSLGLTKGLLRERGWRPDLIAGITWNTDTGQTDEGIALGSSFHELTAAVTASKSQDPLVFVGSLSFRHTFEQDGLQPGDAAGLSLGVALAASPETSLRLFFDQSFVFEDEINGREVSGSDEVVSLFSVGASSLLTSQMLLDIELGIGLTESAPDYTIGISLPVRFKLPLLF